MPDDIGTLERLTRERDEYLWLLGAVTALVEDCCNCINLSENADLLRRLAAALERNSRMCSVCEKVTSHCPTCGHCEYEDHALDCEMEKGHA